jgi:hypothetical protein
MGKMPWYSNVVGAVIVVCLTIVNGCGGDKCESTNDGGATPSVALKWNYGMYGGYIGKKGMMVDDLDDDGIQEIVATASVKGGENNIWYVVRETSDGDYEQVYRGAISQSGIVRLCLADMNIDGKKDVEVAFSDGTVQVYDGPTLRLYRTEHIPDGLNDVAIDDLDNDGKKEVVVRYDEGVSIYDAESFELKRNILVGAGSTLALGNVDSDSSLEIVTSTYDGQGYVLDGTSGSVKWEFEIGFQSRIKLGDVDGDGKMEIVSSTCWYDGSTPNYKISIYDCDLRSLSWEIPSLLDISPLLVEDVETDGIPEIIYAGYPMGIVHAVDGRTRMERWSAEYPGVGLAGIAMADVDRDGKKELIGGVSFFSCYLFIMDPTLEAIKWNDYDVEGLSSLVVGDLTGKGHDDIVMISQCSNDGEGEGVVHIFDGDSHDLLYRSPLATADWMGANRIVKMTDVDGDGSNEMVVTTSGQLEGLIRVYDGSTHVVKAQTVGYDGNSFSALAIGDVDNDGDVEIVAGQEREDSGAAGVFLIVFDGKTLQEKWRSENLEILGGASVYDIKISDLDKDGNPDIVVSMDYRLKVYDGVTHALKFSGDTSSLARALAVTDVDGDGFPEILVGRGDGNIAVYNGVTFNLKKTVSTSGTSSVDALWVGDLDGKGTAEWVIARDDGYLVILKGLSEGNKMIWKSQYLGADLGRHNHITVKDVDGNGHPDIFIGTYSDIYQFEVAY